ncbi:MAG TPA: hypothetical protein VFH13_01525, partial [Gemmatimonadaceae bacterium]|nr:hypothetical protein [Gemmatimonadaceae bacterium]
EVETEMASLNPSDAIVLRIRTSPEARLQWQDMYKAVIGAESLGGAAGHVRLPIISAGRRVCVTAFTVPPLLSDTKPPAVSISPEKRCPLPREGVAAAELLVPARTRT